jgi:membrane associated rhomboid family serine protease
MKKKEKKEKKSSLLMCERRKMRCLMCCFTKTESKVKKMFRAGGGYGGRGRRGGGGGINPFFYYYVYRMYQQYQAVPNKPHGTLVVMAVMAAYYFDAFPLLNDIIGDISSACFSPAKILRDFEFQRLLFSGFIHGDELHLAYNLSSLLTKGIKLEERYGGGRAEKFVLLFCVVSVLTHGFAALIAGALFHSGLFDGDVYYNATYGSSGVLFALQTIVLGENPRGNYSFFGLQVPAHRLALTEVGLLYLMNPSTLNLIVHISGILAGMLVLRPTKVINMLKYIFGFNLFGGLNSNHREREGGRGREGRSAHTRLIGKRCVMTGLSGTKAPLNGTWATVVRENGNEIVVKLDDNTTTRSEIAVGRENVLPI